MWVVTVADGEYGSPLHLSRVEEVEVLLLGVVGHRPGQRLVTVELGLYWDLNKIKCCGAYL
jgi:hypothetical protein